MRVMNTLRNLLLSLLLIGGASTPLVAQTTRSTSAPAIGAGSFIGFGATVRVAGDEVFVGRPGESDVFPMPGSEPGSVHVFGLDGVEWHETATLRAAETTVGGGFGKALDVTESLLAVGAPNENEGRGAVYIFGRDEGGWQEFARLAPEDLEAGDGFGSAIAFGDADLLVGAPGRKGTGAVFAYHREQAGGPSMTEFTADGVDPDGRFGAALSLDGQAVLVGAPGPFGLNFVGEAPQFQAGAAYVFDRSSGDWTQSAQLTVAGGGALGLAVLLSGDHALVSAPIADQGSGTVFHFTNTDGTWEAAGRFGAATPQPQSLFGMSMAMAGDRLVVGAPGANGFHGAAYVLAPTPEGDWVEEQSVSAEIHGLMGFFGNSVGGDEGLLVVGAPAAEFFEGMGYVFTRAEDGEWREAASIVESGGGLEAMVGEERTCPEEGDIGGFSCQNVDLVSFLPVSAIGGARGIMVSDIWGWTDPDTGREYAILGRFDGTSFIDVTDAANPVYLGNLPLTEGAQPNLWRDMKVYANHAYIVADNAGAHGVQIFDLTRLRDVSSPPVDFDEDAHYDGIASAHNIVINEATGFAYTVGNSGGGETCGGALHMIDIRDPENPKFAGCYADPNTGNARTGYTHDAQCVVYHGPDQDYAGHEICFNASETALGIGDVTDKSAPRPIASASYPNVGYSHQGWLSEDQRYFYLDDELDELNGGVAGTRTLIWDIEDLDDPVLAREYISDNPASDHNLYVRGNFMYQSNYVSGLRILDISDPVNPKPVGFFDTVPWSPDAPGFAGSWSNYPFFESGNIIVSSMREGLFVLRKHQRELVP